ncbi:response regulator, partial [Cohnella sp. GbtcB17]|uniref:response regulator n=1 Tax=Cohnella sp. GbtcB17 TaxID=2824762 RepID=UPI001C2F53AE
VHIMVVEDNDDINHLLCSVLRKSGYVPPPAYSGTVALLYLERQKWHLILLDLMLPLLSGEELLSRIGIYGAIPVLILS